MVAWALPPGTPGKRYDRWCWVWWSACVHPAEPGHGGRDYRRSLWRKGNRTDRLDDPQRIRLPFCGQALTTIIRAANRLIGNKSRLSVLQGQGVVSSRRQDGL